MAGASTSPHGPLAYDGILDENDNSDSDYLLTSGNLDSHSALRAHFDWLFMAGEQAGLAKPAKMAYIVAVAKAGLQLQHELALKVTLVQLQAERIAALSALCAALDSNITKCESSVTHLRDEISALQTQAASIQTSMAVRTDAGASAAGRVLEFGRSILSAGKDLLLRASRTAYPEGRRIAAARHLQGW